jgi:hypothetical protein
LVSITPKTTNMKKNYKEKLQLYSALAGGVVLASAAESEAQVVYHDINPDTVVNAANPTYSIDFNNDGQVDFTMNKRNLTTVVDFYNSRINTKDWANVTYSSGFTSDTKFSLGDTVSSVLKSKTNWSYYRLGQDTISDNKTNTNAQWVGGEMSKYLGVQFSDASNIIYYGWIRVNLAADFSSLTFLDYAYESSPGALIKAGATSSVPAVTAILDSDGGNAGNASDIILSFTKASSEANITKYRAFVVPATNGFDLDSAQKTTTANYYYDISKTGANIATTLPSSLLDVFGNPIVNGTAYNVYVMSIGNSTTDDAIAKSASSLTLSVQPQVPPVTMVVATDIANSGNPSDMKITFNKASSETNVASYAVLVVPTSQASGATLDNAQEAVAQGYYTAVAKTGANLSVILSPTAKDAMGNAIAQNTSYEVFVLSLATTGNLDSLSAASAAVTLSGATAVTDPQTIRSGISSYESNVNLQNMPSSGTITVLSTSGAQVLSGQVVSGDNTYSLSYVKTGVYIVNLVLQDQVISKQVYISGR